MRRKWNWIGILVGVMALALIAPNVMAQTTGAITGVVVDQDEEPIPGATVKVTSPSMMGPRGTVTDYDGNLTFRPPATTSSRRRPRASAG